MIRPPPRSTRFPYTTLFRSLHAVELHRKRQGELLIGPARSVSPHHDRRLAAGDYGAGGRDRVAALERLPDDGRVERGDVAGVALDRKSTRLNSSHTVISYAA